MPKFMHLVVTSVRVEYDSPEGRAVKEFKDSTSARKFYTEKFKAGLNPKLTSAAVS